MIRFILNEKDISTDPAARRGVAGFYPLSSTFNGNKDWLQGRGLRSLYSISRRNHSRTRWEGNELQYQSMTCCLMPIGNAHGKHIVTIEGINHADKLNPIQKAMADEGATQCGFCTPGFVMSLAGFCLSNNEATQQNAIAAVDGNICRCTGYKSIERAADKVAAIMKERKGKKLLCLYRRNKYCLPILLT